MSVETGVCNSKMDHALPLSIPNAENSEIVECEIREPGRKKLDIPAQESPKFELLHLLSESSKRNTIKQHKICVSRKDVEAACENNTM